jgi:hypothetical protein
MLFDYQRSVLSCGVLSDFTELLSVYLDHHQTSLFWIYPAAILSRLTTQNTTWGVLFVEVASAQSAGPTRTLCDHPSPFCISKSSTMRLQSNGPTSMNVQVLQGDTHIFCN